MRGLEPISPCPRGTVRERPARPGRLRHQRDECVGRHLHERAFAAIVLSGDYVEAGDTGRHLVGPGAVLFHRRFEAHAHQIGSSGAEVLVLELPEDPSISRGHIEDADIIVRLGEQDPDAAAAALLAHTRPYEQTALDWTDLLACDLASDPALNLDRWAEVHGLHPGSISRGFRRIYALSPAHYRVVQRTRRAVSLLGEAGCSLAEVATMSGFSDQSHMSRAIRLTTGRTPLQLKYPAGSVLRS